MARVPCKHVLLIVFIFLCFISTTPVARSLPSEMKKGLDDRVVTTENEGGAPPDVDELESMDYTPARRKPPIHN
ncbi:hypothetical protein ERO13_A01G042000v2 [Gossypium hirsutum]|uniref:Root meristem growth factor 9 n=2 Tax=Gossypium TaxID=3633 RepID=A0A2P5W9K1_GOSBA|nr:hypothetical protein ES319_A01G039100v1 [Gossypium barbadense]KAG4213233.1 hypothetical protein ERO13_A01G042000v2 [Gossypium hirsutum]PPR87728.1 hypothetical protein GOBAR_AA32967 [Gossypium barbadense]TYH29804.1 hypothetical protein ES288_A01G041300v1 [Gossypium darwinii]